MVWWSSSLVEKDLKSIRADLQQLRKETQQISHAPPTHHSPAQLTLARPHIEEKYPNLLTEDPYFTHTLPKMLGESFRPHGVRREALIGKPEHLHPFNGFRDVSNMTSMCVGTVAQLKFGQYETLCPDLAIKVEARPREDFPQLKEYWVHLRENVFWAPLNKKHFPTNFELSSFFSERHPVTAHDFKFFYDAVMNPYVSEPKAVSLRTYYNDIEEFEVIDALTFVVRWKAHEADGEFKTKYSSLNLTGSLQPLASFVYQHFADGAKILDDDQDNDTYRLNSVWAQNFAHHWAKNVIPSCGPYLFDGMNEEGITFVRNPRYYNPYTVLIEGVHYSFKDSFDAAWQDFKVGNIDLCHVAPNQLLELESFLKSAEYNAQEKLGMKIEAIDYVDRCYYYLGWNLATEFFGNARIRQAMTMAIDRKRIIHQNLNEMAVAITGPFYRYSSAYDSSVDDWPYNPLEAKRILEQEGWVDLDGDGIRDKMVEGKRVPFRFRLCYFVKSLSAKVIAEYIVTALKEIGIECQLYGLDITDLSRQFDDKTFDAIFMGWKHGTPPDDPRQIWHSSGAKEKGSSNAIGFSHPEIDRIIETLNYEDKRAERKQLYHEFHQIIHEETPYTFLYTPKVRLLYREYVKNLFVPRERQDLIPGADISEPNVEVIWLDKHD
ncbi:MAG: permease [Chlamydiales bacterium]|nr:permease [Chlamydiales bacterium]